VGCFSPRRVLALILWQEAHGLFGATALGASMVGGLDGHHEPVMETTLVVWWSLGVSGLHGEWREGVVSVCGGEFLSDMFIFGSHVVVGCSRSRRWLSSFLLRSKLLP
jgi:hypothetical protein